MVCIDDWLGEAEDVRRRAGRPLVTLCYAQSLDGSLTTRRGQSLLLSGEESFRFVHALRAAHQAILVGIGTVLADNPRLTVRLAAGRDPQPVILDSRLRFPLDAVLLRRPGPLPWIATTPQASPQRQAALESAGGRVLRLPAGPDGQVDLNALLACLAGEGIVSLMVEGGAAVISSFLKARLVDRLALTIAPVLVGGQRALETPLFPDSPHNPRSAGGLPRLAEMQTLPMGADLVILGKLA